MSSTARKANRLIHEKSPYLQQHAYNPVDWYPWSDEAFNRAAAEDKPVLLSIGYATCHWCHVMERESFEDQATADLMNREFIAIKLDREERPDVDQIYMRALHATGQHGGWPLNMFLTPDRRPITGGTYFPPRPAYGRPSFQQVLEQIARIWREDRAKALQSAQLFSDFLRQEAPLQPERAPAGALFGIALQQAEAAFDRHRGGFLNNGPNKFPPSMTLLLLLDLCDGELAGRALPIVETTLEHMKRGGIYDQIGGGLSRYSTDHDWLVPHFEKMLYDNALFARALTECFRRTGKPRYREWALDLFEYIERDMTSPDGAFYSAEDADSEGEEGKFYVWSQAEFKETLQAADVSGENIERLLRFWGLSTRPNIEGKNILHETMERGRFLEGERIEAAAWQEIVDQARRALLERRSRRVRPLRDQKILLNWNALMISALCRAGRSFARPDLTERGARCASFLMAKLRQPAGGYLRRYCDGEARFRAQLSDMALFALALLDLYRSTLDTDWLQEARHIAGRIVEQFASPGPLFFESDAESKDLIVRSIESYDGVEPSGNSAAAELFFVLGRFGFEEQPYSQLAEGILDALSGAMAAAPAAHSYALHVQHLKTRSPVEAVIVWRNEASRPAPLIEAFLSRTTEILGCDCIVAGAAEDAITAESAALLQGRRASPDDFQIYVCRDFACQLPTNDIDQATLQLRSAARPSADA